MTICTFETCNTKSTYGIKRTQPSRCKKHKLAGMVTQPQKYCEHDKRKIRCKVCKVCGGSQICEHDKLKSQCIECGGSDICRHNKRKSHCKVCGGSQICKHNKRKSHCKVCGGSAICGHNKQKSQCHICLPDSKYFCNECHYTKSNKKYKGYCVHCYVYKFPDDELSKNAHLKYAELKIKAFLANEFPSIFTHNSRIWFGDCTAPYRRFLDFYVMIGNTLFVIEVDEKQHRGYDIVDEKSRINEILHNIGLDKKMVFLRYNPDAYKVGGRRKITSIEDRLETLKNTVTEVLEILYDDREYEDIHTEIKLFYDTN